MGSQQSTIESTGQYLPVNIDDPILCSKCHSPASYACSWKNQQRDIIQDGKRAPHLFPGLLPYWKSGGNSFESDNIYTACTTCIRNKAEKVYFTEAPRCNWCVTDTIPPIKCDDRPENYRGTLHIRYLIKQCTGSFAVEAPIHNCTADLCGAYRSASGMAVTLEYSKVPNALRISYFKDGQISYFWRCCGSRECNHPKPFCY